MKANEATDVFRYIDTKGGDAEACWPWIGGAGSIYKDRGYFQYNGKKWLAYRLVYELVNGPIPESKVVRHRCDNSLCCNPKHLELGTQSENENDKYLNDRAGIPVAAVREIKRLLQTANVTQQRIAEYVSVRYNYPISREAVRNIKLGLRRGNSDKARTADEVAGFTIQSADSSSSSSDEDSISDELDEGPVG